MHGLLRNEDEMHVENLQHGSSRIRFLVAKKPDLDLKDKQGDGKILLHQGTGLCKERQTFYGTTATCATPQTKMSNLWARIMLLVLLVIISVGPQRSDAELEQWCIADEQTPDDELQTALDWVCGKGGANCSMIQLNKPCYLPNTVKAHASYAFNDYFQNFKHKGGSCYFRGAAIITELDPSYNSCRYEFID